jgi:uncharacterized protein YdbL (DUF1318 family)
MSGNGVVMMQKFIETNGLKNSESPAIFLEVHGLLDKKLKRIKAIEELYANDGDKAPMTKCPECGSPTLVVHNCEFCGYAMIDYEASSEGTVEDAQPATETTTRASRGRGASDKKIEEDTTPDIKENLVETGKSETAEEAPARASRAKAPKMPTKEEINKARRPGLAKIVKAHDLTMTSDLEKAELKDIRIELLSVLLGEETPVKEKKTRTSKVATKKEEVAVPTIDFSKAPDDKALEAMTEDQLMKVITEFGLPLADTIKKLEGELNDDGFFACIDEIVASLKSEEENQSKAEPVVEEKTRARTSRTKKEEAPVVEAVKIDVGDLPEGEALEKLSEKELLATVVKFGLDITPDMVKQLQKGDLKDDAFFKIIDAVDAEIEKIANDINAGKEPTYPVVAETKDKKTARTKKAPASEAKLEAGNETDENYENIDLDNADVNYDDINIEDIATEA